MRALRERASTGDYVVLAAIILFAGLALALHASVAGLGEMASGIRQTGAAIQSAGTDTAAEIRRGVGSAADAIGGLPVVGAPAANEVREAGRISADAVIRETRASGALLIESGRQGEADARRTARLVGWLAFLVPTILLLAQWIPHRLPAWRAGDAA